MDSSTMIEIYNDFFKQANYSHTQSIFCEKVFGIDLTQDGFSDKKQLDFMIELLKLSEKDLCLDIGCGNGRISNYINQKTGASIDGIDSSENAIKFANEFFGKEILLLFKLHEYHG